MRPLFHPSVEEVRPEAILHALSDPERAAIFAEISGAGCVQACSAVAVVGDRTIPKSSLSHDIKVLREAGLIRCERHGVEMRNHSRCGEIEGRFPGLLASILSAYALVAREPGVG
ncbi:helix-turn-helix domain-containing protein [Azospirillum sp. B4]|uniref:winged helix-turn-helix domain-containing protein n=1 Tax=Azospirillum sp. B4 TaxID=95605 RepID=UPI00034CC38C|nr:helix-turn-helix domain-containing protein [Azospirillum sp. B4]